MTPSKPYIVRAIYEWIADNSCTPHIAIDTSAPGVIIPKQHMANDNLVLNISASAVAGLRIGNDAIEFKARFGGVSHNLYIPIAAVLGIYARENSQGMTFQPENTAQDPTINEDDNEKKVDRPKFAVVAGGKNEKTR